MSNQQQYSYIKVNKAGEPVEKVPLAPSTDDISQESLKTSSEPVEVSSATQKDPTKRKDPIERKDPTKRKNPTEESALDSMTLQDLKSTGPMEHLHKIILAVLILGLIAFIVYIMYFSG
ncbi:MAG: hypothetical protein ACLU06_05195 [Eggerthellaceae bacterium]